MSAPSAERSPREPGRPAHRSPRWLLGLEHTWETLRTRFSGSSASALRIVPFRGYGNTTVLHLSGRVLREGPPAEQPRGTAWWHGARQSWRRFESDEVAGAVVVAETGTIAAAATTDAEGYFTFELVSPSELRPEKGWLPVSLKLLAHEAVTAQGWVLLPDERAQFAVISDLDDTVLVSEVTRRWRMMRHVVFGTAHTRLPFNGVAAFYGALQEGVNASGPNPIFYVSGSPWNLYELLVEFLDVRLIPLGPLLLRDFGIDAEKFIHEATDSHKGRHIAELLAAYPRLPFLLIGDSGERDPEIYTEAVRQCPGRVGAIYIRKIAATPQRMRQVAELAEETRQRGAEMVLIDDTEAAAQHAVKAGYIRHDWMPAVSAETQRDALA